VPIGARDEFAAGTDADLSGCWLDGLMEALWPSEDRVLLHAEGLVLREWTYDDVPAMVELFDTDEMNRWTPLPSRFDEEAAKRYVEAAHRLRVETHALQPAITLDGQTPRGEVLVFPGGTDESVELAFAVGADHRGRGLARRAVNAVLALASESRASTARLVIAMDNPSSRRVAQATGFRLTGEPLTERRRKGFVLTMATWERPLTEAP
jgi:RimJ/RimL family protein N-acetyltransferase